VARHVAVVDGWLTAQGLTGATGANDSDTQGRCFPFLRGVIVLSFLLLYMILWVKNMSRFLVPAIVMLLALHPFSLRHRSEFMFTDSYLVLLLVFDEALPLCVALRP